MIESTKLPPQQGWQCPICDKVNAPFVLNCDCHIKITSADTTSSYIVNTNNKLNDVFSAINTKCF